MCPKCKSAETVPIVYGLPDWDLGRAAERGELVLGGCMVTDDDPRWRCRACEADFGRPSEAQGHPVD